MMWLIRRQSRRNTLILSWIYTTAAVAALMFVIAGASMEVGP